MNFFPTTEGRYYFFVAMGQQASSSGDGYAERRLVIHSALTQEYKDATFGTIADCYQALVDIFGSGMLTKFTLTEEEFDTVFGLAFGDPKEHFREIWSVALDDEEKNEDGSDDWEDAEPTANVFHVFCALFLLCQEELQGLDAKVGAIYRIFDFDGSGALNQVELECLLQACAAGLCRATGTRSAATVGQIEDMALEVLAGREEATLAAVKGWLYDRGDVLLYLSDFLEARMVADYQRKVEELFERTTQQFVAASFGEPPVITTAEVTAIVRALPGSSPTDDEIDAFVAILDSSDGASNGVVGWDEFSDAIMAWIAFSVVDDDATRTLSPDELKLLIWISGGECGPEPTPAIVRKATEAMDVDRDGSIVRLEWLKYNAATDPATGTIKFSKAGRDLFRQLAGSAEAVVKTRDLRLMFQTNLTDILTNLESGETRFASESRRELAALVEGVASEIADIIDVNADGVISWDEFVVHLDAIVQKQEKTREYAKFLLAADLRACSLKPKCSAITRARGKSKLRMLTHLSRPAPPS